MDTQRRRCVNRGDEFVLKIVEIFHRRHPEFTREQAMGVSALLRRERRLSLFDQRLERRWFANGEVRQNFTVQINFGLFQTIDELGVVHAVLPGAGVDSR